MYYIIIFYILCIQKEESKNVRNKEREREGYMQVAFN